MNTALKWIGIVGGIVGLIISGFMIYTKESQKAAVTNVSTIAVESNVNNLDNVSYLKQRVDEIQNMTNDVD